VIAPPLLLLGLGLLPVINPTEPATKAEPRVIVCVAGDIHPKGR
jgi:hypothetical protein